MEASSFNRLTGIAGNFDGQDLFPADPVWIDGGSLREPALLGALDPRWTERHLQCVWYDERWRPVPLVTSGGEEIEVILPGRWNLEAGPDFIGAELRLGPERRTVRGDVEVHVRPADWERHRHGDDARYANVVLHVTYYDTSIDDKRIPPHILRVALQAGLAANRRFAFEDIDVAAYPHAIIPATPRPCAEALQKLGPEHHGALLVAAGRHRLRAKAARLSTRLRTVGDRYQVFYEEVMAVLGYKQNTAACRRLAESLPLSSWPAGATADHHYARLLGAAGLLPDPAWMSDDDARNYVRILWDAWFQSGGSVGNVADEIGWTLGGMRPVNHPLRRLAAAAALFADPQRLLDLLSALPTADPVRWMKSALQELTAIEGSVFWQMRQSLDSAPGPRRIALLGKNRASAMVANAVLPLLIAENPAAEVLADALPSEDLGAPARETSFHLFGRDHNPAFYRRSGLMQQGLLAIYQDFCLTSREGCLNCPLAERLRQTADAQ